MTRMVWSLSAQHELLSLYTGDDGANKTIDGGDPIYLDSNITLCGRGDKTGSRAFTGRLTSLYIFDDALSPAQVAPYAFPLRNTQYVIPAIYPSCAIPVACSQLHHPPEV
jgi:hypothetical protein